MNTNTGSYIALAGVVVMICAKFGIIVTSDSVAVIIAGAVSLYGIIHQYVITRKVVSIAKSAGVKGFK